MSRILAKALTACSALLLCQEIPFFDTVVKSTEVVKYENIKNQPRKVLLLVNEYTKVLKNVGEIIRSRTPGEQKTAIGYFLDQIEVLRDEGIARCYFFTMHRAHRT